MFAPTQARVPATVLFRTGGDTTVRGYSLREIGVRQDDGSVAAGHTLAVARQLARQLSIELVLAIDGLAPRAARRLGDQLGVGRIVLQGRGGLGVRMQRQFQRAATERARRVVLIGSDLPQLERADLASAFAALDHQEAVLGPACDGGYWLIGLRRPEPALMEGIAWGSEQVLEQTLAALARRGLEPALLPWRRDLDRGEDLGPWR